MEAIATTYTEIGEVLRKHFFASIERVSKGSWEDVEITDNLHAATVTFGHTDRAFSEMEKNVKETSWPDVH